MSGRTFNQETYDTANLKTQSLLKEFLLQHGLIPIETNAEIFKNGDIIIRLGSNFKAIEGELRAVTTQSPWIKRGDHYYYGYATLSVVERKAEDPNTPVLFQVSFTEEEDGCQNAIVVLFEDVLKAKPEDFYAATRGEDQRRLIPTYKTVIFHRKNALDRWEVCSECRFEEDHPSVITIKMVLGLPLNLSVLE